MYKPTKARRVICMLLALVMCMSLAPTVSFADNGNVGSGGSTIGTLSGGGTIGEIGSAGTGTLQGVR